MLTKYYPILNKVSKEIADDISSLGSMIVVFGFAILILTLNQPLGIQLLTGLIIIEVIGNLLKLFIKKKRPDKEPQHNIIEKLHAASFPSIHSARVLYITLALYSFSQNLTLTILLGITALLVGISRVILKRHFLVDIIVGYILGIAVWYFI